MMRLKWLDTNENVIHWTIDGDWNDREYNQALAQWKALSAGKSYTVDVIIDMRTAGRIPSNAVSLTWQSILGRPDNLGVTLVVSRSKLIRTVYKSMEHVYGGHDSLIIFSADWEGAIDILHAAQGSRVKTK